MAEPTPRSKNPLRKLARSFQSLSERHEHRRRPSGFSFALADRVDYLDPELWDRLTRRQSIFLRRDVLRVIEQHGPDSLTPRYVLIFRDHEPVAALAAQIVTVKGHHLGPAEDSSSSVRRQNLLRRALKPTARAATANLRARVLVAGNLLSWGFHGVALAPSENPTELWPGVAEALYRLRCAERLSGQTDLVMVKDLTSEQAGLDALHCFSYRPLRQSRTWSWRLTPHGATTIITWPRLTPSIDGMLRINSKSWLPLVACSSH
jgi:hypothetical protein